MKYLVVTEKYYDYLEATAHASGIPTELLNDTERHLIDTLGKFKLRPATTPPASGMCIAIYGVPGVGKTTLAAQAALSNLGKPVLVIDAEGGSRAIAHMQDVYIADVKTWKEVVDVSNTVANTKNDFKTVVLDNMSEFQQIHMRSIVTGNNMPEIRDWGRNSNEMLGFTRLWRDISRDQGLNVIFIAWEAPELDESSGAKIIKRDLGFTPSLARQFPGIIDLVGHLTVDNQGTRILNFSPSNRTAAKFRRSQNEAAAKIPLTLYFGLNEYPLVDILNTLKGGLDWPQGKYLKKQQAST
jgi:phage nucleotide-binding protein